MSSTLIDRTADGIVQIVKHHLTTASYGFGLARGLAAATIRVASGGGGSAHAEWVAPPGAPSGAVTRDSAHGAGGADVDIDDWYGETFLDDHADEPTDERAILSNAETSRRAAERVGERA